jgi:hypothetical protein
MLITWFLYPSKDAMAAILTSTQASPYFTFFFSFLFFKLVCHLAYIINATSSLLPSSSFSCYAAISVWPLLTFSTQSSNRGTGKNSKTIIVCLFYIMDPTNPRCKHHKN